MRRLCFVLLCALALALGGPAAAAQEGEVNFVAEPVPGSQTAPRGAYFLLKTAPGAQVSQSIGLRNDASEPLNLRLAAVDAVTGQLGGASYAIEDEPRSATGTWITLERTEVTLAPKASAIVSFTVAVPAGAESGHHLAGISVIAPKKDTTTGDAGSGRAGASVDVHTRRIIAVQVELPGPAEPELVIKGVSPAARPDGLYVEIAIDHVGRALTKGTGRISVDDDFDQSFEIDTFVPRTSIAYPIKWSDVAEGRTHRAEVEVTYGDEQKVARWEGEFTVGDEVRDELADRQVEPQSESEESGGGIPLAALVGVGAAAVAAGGWTVARLTRPQGKHLRKR